MTIRSRLVCIRSSRLMSTLPFLLSPLATLATRAPLIDGNAVRARLLLCISLLALHLGPVTHAAAQEPEPTDDSATPHVEVDLVPVSAPASAGAEQVLQAGADLASPVNVVGVTWPSEETAEVQMRTRQGETWSQ